MNIILPIYFDKLLNIVESMRHTFPVRMRENILLEQNFLDYKKSRSSMRNVNKTRKKIISHVVSISHASDSSKILSKENVSEKFFI
jgi:hypothetical protein